jgi:hypothetical protein
MYEEIDDPGLLFKLLYRMTRDKNLAEDQAIDLVSDNLRQGK